MVCFLQICCPCWFRRRRAGSSRGGSTVSDRPSSERRLGNRQPEGQEGGEPPRENELEDAAVQPDAPQFVPQPGDSITTFPPIDGSSDGDDPSNDVSQQDPPQRDTSSRPGTSPPYTAPMGALRENTSSPSDGAPQANDTQTHVCNPSNDVSQNDTPLPGSAPGSHSTATGPFPEYEDPMGGNQDTRCSSDGAPQAEDTQTNVGNPSNDVSQQGAPQHGTPRSRSTAAGPYDPHDPYRHLMSVFMDSASGSSDDVEISSIFSNEVESTSSSSDGDPQADVCKPSNDVESTSGSSDGVPQVSNSQTDGAQNSSDSQRDHVSSIPHREREVLELMTLFN